MGTRFIFSKNMNSIYAALIVVTRFNCKESVERYITETVLL